MFEAANTLIEKRLENNWLSTEIDSDNVDFVETLGTPFIRLQIEWTYAYQASIGGRDRGEGYVMVSILVPGNTGTKIVSQMADSVAAIYNKWNESGLKFKIARTQRVGAKNEWYQVNVLVDFRYDECN